MPLTPAPSPKSAAPGTASVGAARQRPASASRPKAPRSTGSRANGLTTTPVTGSQAGAMPSGLVIPTGEVAMQQGLSSERQELLCSVIGLVVKVGLVLVAGVSLARLASAYQERMERQGELSAVLDLERAKLAKARERFDHLFMVDGEQRLIREQNQWIAPNRLRVVWQSPEAGRANP